MSRRLAARAVCTVALALCTAVQAAPFAVQLGLDRLVIDTPPGFTDSGSFGSPRLTEIAENLAEASSRVLAFALADADARKFAVGDSLDLRRYLLAVTPRATERDRMTAAQFAALVQTAGRGLGPAPDAKLVADLRAYLKERAPQQAHLIADFKREPQLLSVMQGTMIPQPGRWIDGPPLFKVSSMTLVLVGGKAVYLSAFSAYDGPADAEWVRTVAERWLEDLQRLNR
jgi:hypothetical protein